MGILVVAVGEVEKEVLRYLTEGLAASFGRPVSIGKTLPEPGFALDGKRGQFLSTAILNDMMDRFGKSPCERVLGVVEGDLYAMGMNFVFGEAGAKAAVIGLRRLREGFYGRKDSKALFLERALKEAIHELGHTYGLGHCSRSTCIMFFSNTLADTDGKGPGFCPKCAKRLETALSP